MASRSQLKLWRSLRRSKGRAQTGLFIVEGPRCVAELLESPLTAEALLYLEPVTSRLGALVEAFGARDVPSHVLSVKELESVADTDTPQGIVAVAAIPSSSWEDLGNTDLIVLDAVQDPGNVGTIVRAAEGFGWGGIVVLPGTAEPWSSKATRAAAGSSLRVPIVEAQWAEARGHLCASGHEVWAADAEGEPVARPVAPRPPVALVLGNEGAGVSEEVLRDARRRVAVPLEPPVGSLNVGVAGAVLMDRLREGIRDR